MAIDRKNHDEPQAAGAASRDYDELDEEQFRTASDRLLRFLSTSIDGTWRAVIPDEDTGDSNYPGATILRRILDSLRLTKLGIRSLDDLLGAPIYRVEDNIPQYRTPRERTVDDLAFELSNEVKPYHFANIWRTFVDLRDGKIDHDTAMRRTESTHAKIHELINRHDSTYDMIEKSDSLESVIAWARLHGSRVPLPNDTDNPRDEDDYRYELRWEFSGRLCPGAADLADERLDTLVARHTDVLTINQRAILGMLFYTGRNHTRDEIARRTGIDYRTVTDLIQQLQAFGLIEQHVKGKRLTYALASPFARID